MAIYGISGAPLPVLNPVLPYAATIQNVCEQKNCPPCLAYAIGWGETIGGEVSGWLSLTYGPNATARTCISRDGGHGIFQLTSSFPPDWDDPFANCAYAVSNFILPAMHYFAGQGKSGDVLVDCVADAFNEGTSRVDSFLKRGIPPDVGTTGSDYGENVLRRYRLLVDGKSPA